MKSNLLIGTAIVAMATAASAVVTAPSGYIYSTQLLGSDTQSCVAAGPGGTFVAVGPGFTANAQSVVFVRESGDARLVASGFNSVADCAYDAANDVLYVTDNADNADLGIVSPFAAQTGDTIFAIPSASTASALTAPNVELLPADSLEDAASVAVDGAGDVFVGDSVGGGAGSVIKITGGVPAPFVSGFDFTAGITFDPATANLFVAETLAGFNVQIRQFTPAGTPVAPAPLVAPTFAVGSYDLAFDKDGQMLATGLFGGDVVSIDPLTGTPTPFISGLNFATGATVDAQTGRIELLSSTFASMEEDKSLHRFTPIDALVPGKGSASTECVQEFYGIDAPDSKTATCVDGGPCDADGAVNDRCTFPIGFCLNVDDPDFSDCESTNSITSVEITAKPFSVGVAEASDRLVAALPLADSTCFFSEGAVVPVKITGSGDKKDGNGKIKVKTETDAGQKDTDNIKLVCQPAP